LQNIDEGCNEISMLNANVSPIPLTPQELQEYSDFLSQLVGTKCVASTLYKLNDGANQATHLVIETTSGEAYGLKSVTRVGAGCLREKTAADIAILVQAPSACGCNQARMGFGILNNQEVSVIKWLETGRRLDRIPAAEIKADSISFFEQFGEWTILAVYLGISDRVNGGNWVYDPGSKRLAMVDLEDAFTSQPQLNFVPWAVMQYADVAQFKSMNISYPVRCAFAMGIIRMILKFKEREAEIVQLIQQAGLNYVLPPLVALSEEETIMLCINAV
jgi:hypothetical protein